MIKVNRLRSLGLHRIDVLAGYFFHELGVDTLRYAPPLLMGFRSVMRSPLLSERESELIKLRQYCMGLTTINAIKIAAVRYNDASLSSGHSRLFVIDERSLKIKPKHDIISRELRIALDELKVPDAPPAHTLSSPNAESPIGIHIRHAGESRRYWIKSLPSGLPKAVMHDQERELSRRLSVSWEDLLQEARGMDLIDEQKKVARPGNWYQRLRAVALSSVDSEGEFHIQSHLELDGLKHLIGLPGTGKTTLLMCLLRYLGVRGIKVAVFFPSIEVCRQYLEDLGRYGVATGLLMGRSRETRQRHAHKLAESLATEDPLNGFGVASESASLFEGMCALPSLTSAPASAFGVFDSFCTNVVQKKSSSPSGLEFEEDSELGSHLCPVWSLCGFTRAARDLPKATVWLGHIKSADTHVPRHTTPFEERYFELIARTFDVVIFDEADRAQQDLDQGGIAELILSGHDRSFHRQIQRNTLQPIASGQNALLQGLDYAQFAIEIAEFERLNVALIHATLQLSDELRKKFDGLLLSPLRIIGEWLSPKRVSGITEDLTADPQAQTKDAFCELWESAAVRAFQQRGKSASAAIPPADVVARTAAKFGISHDAATKLHNELWERMVDWLAESSLKEIAKTVGLISDLLKSIRRPADDAEALQVIGLLVPVTFTILAFRRLVPRLNDMTADGLLEEVHIAQLASNTLLAASPDNILGSLSGVRFISRKAEVAQSQKAHDVQLQYVLFAGTPRLLIYKLHEWIKNDDGTRSGPAVLLTSATSYLPPSPAHHIPVTPQYVLQRHELERIDAPESRYYFRPIRDGKGEDAQYLRFSGEGSDTIRRANLEKMVSALLENGLQKSQVARDCASFDVREGVPRRAAFIVNSYDQARYLKQYIDAKFPVWRDKVVAVVDDLPGSGSTEGYVTSSRVEGLGDDERWQILIFPPGALGRGVNVVFTSGPRRRDAVIGTMYFLTRPHPAPTDMSLVVSMAARATLDFDLELDQSTAYEQFGERILKARSRAYRTMGRLLRRPLYARSLGEIFEPFTANMAVGLLQTIGRAMRNGCPVQCFFVDRAWAEKTARGERDNEKTSMLLQLRQILERGVNAPDKREAALYKALYGTFLTPLSKMEGMEPASGEPSASSEEPWTENPFWTGDSPVEEDNK